MKLAIFTDAFHPQINGIVTSVISIAQNMADRGHEVLIVAPSYKKLTEYAYPGVRVIRVRSISASFYDDFRWTNPYNYSTYKILRNENIDIVHFMTPVFISLIGIKFARIMKIPVIGTFHTFIANPLYFEHLFKGPVKLTEEIAWTYLNYYYDCADYVTTPTEEAVKVIAANGCKAPLEAISNGIDFKQFDNSRAAEIAGRYGLGDKVVLYVGRVANEKNLDILIDAFDLVWTKDKGAQLLVIGDGPQMADFQQYAASKESAGSIIFTGSIAHKELVRSGVFKVSALFATASRTETQGITILEAQANGLPTVAVREGGVINLVKDGENGYLTEPGDSAAMADKIALILKDKDSLEPMVEKTLELVDIHRMGRIIDRWEDLYADIIARKDSLPEKDYLHFSTLLKFSRSFKVDFRYVFRKLNPTKINLKASERSLRKMKKIRWRSTPLSDVLPGMKSFRTALLRRRH